MNMRKAITGLHSWWRRENGTATVEFVILFPIIMTLFLSAFEVSFYLARAVLLDRALDINVRELRLGTLDPMTHEQLKTQICNDALIFGDCPNSILIELTPVSTETWDLPDPKMTCVDRDAELQPTVTFDSGRINDLMVVRACSVQNPFFATTDWVLGMPKEQSGGVIIAAASTFVNEP